MFLRHHLLAMLLLTSVVMVVGAAQKAPCASRAWVEDRRSPPILCDSDIPNLLASEQLLQRSVPYLDACAPAERPCDEYPPVTMFAMVAMARVAAGSADPYRAFYWTAFVVLLACALLTTLLLERIGARTVLFAAGPVLLVTGMANFDLIVVVLATAATVAFLRRRDGLSGALLGAGAAAKLYPAALLVPFIADRWHTAERDRSGRLALGAVLSWLVLNLPFALFATASWLVFFRFNAERGADYTSVWTVVCRWVVCPSPRTMNIASAAITVGVVAAIWVFVTRRHPETPRWIMGFPIIAMMLLTGKVWASHYALWILPWLAVTSIPTLSVIEYQLAEVAVYLVAYHYFRTVNGDTGPPYGLLAVLVLVRALLLIRCVVAWMREPDPVVATPAEAPSRLESAR